MTYTEPNKKDLARLAADIVGYNRGVKNGLEKWMGEIYVWLNDYTRVVFVPHESKDHAQLLIDHAFANGYDLQLAEEIVRDHNGEMFYKIFFCASAEHITRAFLRAYNESKQ